MYSFSFESGRRKTFISLLCFELWFLISVALGMLLAFLSNCLDPVYARNLLAGKQSVGMLLLSMLLPLGVTYLAVSWNSRGMLLITVFCKTVLFAFALTALMIALPNAGWLAAFLVLFTRWLGMVAYHWIWLRCAVFSSVRRVTDFLICAAILIVAFLCEYFIFRPFTASLFII